MILDFVGYFALFWSEWPIILNSKVHLIWPKTAKKRTKRCTKFFPQKSPFFFVKGAQFLTPQTIFIAFSCIIFLEMSNFAIFFCFFLFFIIFFLLKAFFIVLQRRTNFFQGATLLWKSHQCAPRRTLLATLFQRCPTPIQLSIGNSHRKIFTHLFHAKHMFSTCTRNVRQCDAVSWEKALSQWISTMQYTSYKF